MTAATALIPGLDDIIKHGAPERRIEAARRIADLFFQDAPTLQPRHIDLFDGLLIDLVPHADVDARVDLAEVKPDSQARIKQAIAELSTAPEPAASARNFVPAQRTILALYQAGGLDESALLGFARRYQYEESIAALAALAGLKIVTLDRLISGDRHDPILIIGRTIGLAWATVHALVLLRLGPKRVPAPADIETSRLNYARLMPQTAERVVAFWKTRH
jgi:hypothetical protein